MQRSLVWRDELSSMEKIAQHTSLKENVASGRVIVLLRPRSMTGVTTSDGNLC